MPTIRLAEISPFGLTHLGAAGHAAFSAAAVADAQIQVNDDIAPHPDVLSPEDRRASAVLIAAGCIGEDDFLRRNAVRPDGLDETFAVV